MDLHLARLSCYGRPEAVVVGSHAYRHDFANRYLIAVSGG